MSVRDLSLVVTDAFQAVSSISDSNQNDISNELRNVTITNQCNVAVHVINSGKSSVTGIGRILQPNESFNYLELKRTECFIKADSSPNSDSRVIISFNQ